VGVHWAPTPACSERKKANDGSLVDHLEERVPEAPGPRQSEPRAPEHKYHVRIETIEDEGVLTSSGSGLPAPGGYVYSILARHHGGYR
jgi:hypothetical protein